MQEKAKIVLASASPRRVELLASAGIVFEVMAGDVDETPEAGEGAEEHVLRLARSKAEAVAGKASGRYFIGADTVVVCNGEIMGKPHDAADAERMLQKLSGAVHDVITGFAIYDKVQSTAVVEAVRTRVFFKQLRPEEITAYIATGCPFDKAGAYAIQGGAAHMIKKIDGSYSNVVGLPLCEVVETLRLLGAFS